MSTFRHPSTSMLALVVIIAAILTYGCTQREDRTRRPYGVDPMESPLVNSAAYKGTIGEKTYYEGMTPMFVRGYGLVVGLGKRGSSDCPERIRSQLTQSLYKHYDFSSPTVGTRSITPESLIADPDTAVVIVEGAIPPAAVQGARFDVSVKIYPGTSTESLRGGRLYTTDLRIYRMVGPTTALTGKVLARASGPLYLNPFADTDSATRVSPLHGTILGGGVTKENRRVRLVLVEPSYGQARRIQDRVNQMFPRNMKVADATSPSYVHLRLPPHVSDNAMHLLSLIRATYLSPDPAFADSRSLLLAQEIFKPEAPHGLISLCFEGLGRTALPELNRLYVRPEKHVSFYSAAAGLRLGDHIAVDAMAIHAEDPNSAYRFRAIRAMGLASGMANAAVALRRLLDDPDPRVQIAAYEALIGRNDTSITSHRIGGDNFYLDIVPTKGKPFVYAKRYDERRIALFGGELACVPPLFYRAPDASIAITAEEEDTSVSLVRVPPRGSVSPRISAPLDLANLVRLLGDDPDVIKGEVTGLSLDYGAVVRLLYNLCSDQSISGEFILEQPNALEMFGPAKLGGREESEL